MLALALAACGDDKPSLPGGDAALFIGNWNVSAGTFTCTGLGPPVPLTGETVAVAAGGDAPIQATVRGCVVKFDISRLEATARSPQMCQVNVTGVPVPVDLKVTSGRFVVVPMTGGSSTGVLTLSGTVVFFGQTSACEATANVNKAS